MINRKQSRSERRAIVKANQSVRHEPVDVLHVRTNWQAVDRKASPYAATKGNPVRVGYLDREAMITKV